MALSCCKKCIKLPALLRGITSKHDGNCYCSNSLHSFRTELKKHEKVCKNYDFYRVIVHENSICYYK